jgi:hypothetical protein
MFAGVPAFSLRQRFIQAAGVNFNTFPPRTSYCVLVQSNHLPENSLTRVGVLFSSRKKFIPTKHRARGQAVLFVKKLSFYHLPNL